MTLASVTGLLVGAAYGFVSQRGAFCMNSGFRVVVTKRDFTKVKAYVLAIAVQLIAVPLVFAAGLAEPTYPALYPLGAVLGGLLFGASMRWAGGCAAGVLYKVGEGSAAALPAVAGMALGASALAAGPLGGLRESIQSVGGGPAAGLVGSELGIPWALAALIGAALIVVLLRTRRATAGAWQWRRTGLLIGLVGVAAWPAAALAERDFGMAVIPGAVALFSGPVANLLTWDVLLVVGIPIGAFAAARSAGPVKAGRIDLRTAAKRFAGGLGLGVGASLAAGCTVGHGLTGLPLFAPGSLLAMAAIFGGSALTALPALQAAKRQPNP